MRQVAALAHITFLNGLRQYAVWGLSIFALALQLSGIFFADFFGHELGRAASDFAFSIMWLAGALFVLFYAAPTIAWGDDNRTIDSILARPISRGKYVIGLLLGMIALLLMLEGILGLAAIGILSWIKEAVAQAYFPVLSHAHYLLAWLSLQLQLVTLIATVLLISSAIRGAFPVMLLTISYALICAGLPVVQESLIHKIQSGADLQQLAGLLHGLSFLFPDFSQLDFKDAVLSDSNLETIYGLSPWQPLLMFTFYSLTLVGCASLVYQRRDIL